TRWHMNDHNGDGRTDLIGTWRESDGRAQVGVLALALPAADGRAVDAGRGQAVAAPRSTGAQPLLVSGEQRKTLFDVIV
ncbi:MAG TPA: hypothetical protein DCY47_08900, partial [Candidatus Accumulibacter sp.]|nr:hypothetical protein [Accumulibacter sp.]